MVLRKAEVATARKGHLVGKFMKVPRARNNAKHGETKPSS